MSQETLTFGGKIKVRVSGKTYEKTIGGILRFPNIFNLLDEVQARLLIGETQKMRISATGLQPATEGGPPTLHEGYSTAH
jgi:hypothetical protein